jgi:lipopolysaccharide biosynthesis regulator YciM
MGSSVDRLEVVEDTAGWTTGLRAKGEFRCAGCGYGVTVYKALPECPMCRGTAWERVPWRPFSRTYSSGHNVS